MLPLPSTTPDPPDPDADYSWIQHAACRGCDPNIFFTSRGENRQLNAAKRICATCTVSPQCLEYALQQPFTCQGVYGGTSERERRKIRLRNNRQARLLEIQSASRP